MITVPKRLSGVQLQAQAEPIGAGVAQPDIGNLRLLIRNLDSRETLIGGTGTPKGTEALKPGDSVIVAPRPEGTRSYIGSVDTSKAPLRLQIEIISGRPEGTAIHILGYSTDAW